VRPDDTQRASATAQQNHPHETGAHIGDGFTIRGLMRAFAGLVVALSCLVGGPAVSHAGSHPSDDPPARPTKAARTSERAKPHKSRSSRTQRGADKAGKPGAATRAARTTSALRARDRLELRELATGQSIGEPWQGRLQHPTQLLPGEGYVIRRPARSFGTATTVELVERAISETLEAFPDEHVLAIGDISAESGGTITQHRSHQSGRDIDVGLFYNEQPAGYPASFIHADEDNLDCAATFKLLENFLATTDEDGGVQMIFLDFDVQGILYAWALDHGISEHRLARIFQYPHGRGSSAGIVRHVPNHDNHMHVRFQCPAEDTACR
jgi:hypothetical protein